MMLRSDLQTITELIADGSKVLDLGCGDGVLLESLIQNKHVRGRGIELSEAGVLACVKRGLSVRQGDLEEGLADYPDASFDYVILSQTLPFVDNPGHILSEMLRVGRQAIVSFSNWGYWRCRYYLLTHGRIPQAPDLPQAWYNTPRWQAFTIADFSRFCRQQHFSISRQVFLSGDHRYTRRRFKNLFSTTAVFCLENSEHQK
ncbi:MAG: methionine biosynthesis protein MetW [Anaerolineae bacterium]|nr:methionine biosynthesis protein MetW [Anaerolineae bacterium]